LSGLITELQRQAVPSPVFRNLRVFAVDPGMTARFETAVLNEMTVRVPWEDLQPGPVGEYVEVVDEDETGTRLHSPIDLDQSELLAQNGLPPSDGNPHFRQQMVYAVAMNTIQSFERALGRAAHWRPQANGAGQGRRSRSEPAYQKRLVLYPNYDAVANAYYSPAQGALCFGYFESLEGTPYPGTLIFTSLSQDVIAHELTHALLMGMNIEFEDSPNSDAEALHEAFADLVALFQHFGPSEVLREQIAIIRGNLEERSPLGAVALQFGQAIGSPDGLRNALGFTDGDGNWKPRRPDPGLYQSAWEAHQRGDVLVAAVFDAFKKIYESRVADLRRLATRGTGILPEGQLHPDLVRRFSHEAAESARQVLDMCIRALDYLPPVDITFGDYLRAIVTADYDLVPVDERRYRIAFLDAFRSYGILPPDLGTLAVDTLLWPAPPEDGEATIVAEFADELSRRHTYWNLPRDREQLWRLLESWKSDLKKHLRQPRGSGKRLGVIDLTKPFEVRTLDLRQRARLTGELSSQWVVKIVQTSGRPPTRESPQGSRGFKSAGCTLLIDSETGAVLHQIEKEMSGTGANEKRQATDLMTRSSAEAAVAPRPSDRKLRVFAFDPSLGIQLETAGINEVTLRVSWERDARGRDCLEPGPIGEYIEVVDRDPASGCFYEPVDLNYWSIVAQDGLPPSESNPQFHQQMVYAVTMRTIRHFERALGRVALWSPRHYQTEDGSGKKTWHDDYVPRLRVYPHGLREANAYYSPVKKALLFGYFPAPSGSDRARAAPLTVFTCLSHDIIAHETTHALLDGIHRRFNEASNPDVLAFHEAFADLVALFLHFSLPDVLRQQIAATRGDLESQNNLGELAQQFGQAIGKRGALRSAIGKRDEEGNWVRAEPDPDAYERELEPHARGSILVAAVFDAFLTIYKARVADLLRIASEGTGILPAGELHPDLVNRLADEAAASARHVLDMCIRALDYCPPVDVTFGDYLRAVVTADFEFDPVDEEHRRVAFVDAFRRRGIVPEDIRTLSVDGLLWRPTAAAPDEDENVVLDVVKEWAVDIRLWNLARNRRELFDQMARRRSALHGYIKKKMHAKGRKDGEVAVLSGIDASLPFEVHSIRPSVRTDWSGRPRFQWVVELTQRIGQFVDPADEQRGATPDYYFRGGCTLLIDAETGKVRYSIKKRLDDERRERQRRFLLEEGNESLAATYFGGVTGDDQEPFAMLHRF
jgi:hypothetical protein